jgi:16S rRNA A1518/A1519 N6-dimethyltransferase RsmA/KsgA/DIM1 with predicted DNA glycosylase/AP lyase activity
VPGRGPASRRRRELGQHDLADRKIAARLVADARITSADRVVEIGPGSGALTEAIACTGAAVIAIELDRSRAGLVAARFRDRSNVTVWCGDALEFPLPLSPFRVFGNPPFNRTSALLRRLLGRPTSALCRVDFIVQWQVARERQRAGDGEAADLVGALWGPWWEVRRGRRLPASMFRPPPNVDAAMLTVVRREQPLLDPRCFTEYRRFLELRFRKNGSRAVASLDTWARRFARASPHSMRR